MPVAIPSSSRRDGDRGRRSPPGAARLRGQVMIGALRSNRGRGVDGADDAPPGGSSHVRCNLLRVLHGAIIPTGTSFRSMPSAPEPPMRVSRACGRIVPRQTIRSIHAVRDPHSNVSECGRIPCDRAAVQAMRSDRCALAPRCTIPLSRSLIQGTRRLNAPAMGGHRWRKEGGGRSCACL